MTRRTLVTGGAGFIGRHLVRRLLELGERVIVLDNMSSGYHRNLHPTAEFVEGDIRDAALVASLVARADDICHLAALVSVQSCISNWAEGHAINLSGALNVFDAARSAGNRPVVYASSAAVYGDREGRVCREDSPPRPISPYAADKVACEHQAEAMAQLFGLPSVGLRFFNVYGSFQDTASPYAGVISKFCANRMADLPHTIFGDGLQSRDFVHVSDVVESILLARDTIRHARPAKVFNVCTGRSVTLLDIAALIDRIAGRGPTPVIHLSARAGDIRESRGDPACAAQELGFAAGTGIRAGLTSLLSDLEAAAKSRRNRA